LETSSLWDLEKISGELATESVEVGMVDMMERVINAREETSSKDPMSPLAS
jgi:hypothetical protein